MDERTDGMQVRHFDSDGIEIAFIDEGEGDPILLIHGFASNFEVNWVGTGWVSALLRAGCRVIALDNRGHGQSEKIYDPAAYAASEMAKDARRLLDHLGIEQAAVMGYSMGARITAFLAMAIRSASGPRSSAGSGSIWCVPWPARGRSPTRSKRRRSTT